MLHQLSSRARAWFHSKRQERELDDELRFHVEKQTEANLSLGMTPEEARRQALLALGGIDKTREEYRDALGLRLLSDLAQDLRYGLRQLRRSPGFTAVAVITLALGIGANTTIFALLDAIVLRFLPVASPEQLVVVAAPAKSGFIGTSHAYGVYSGIADHAVFEGVLAQSGTRLKLDHGGAVELLGAEMVTGNYFQVLGTRPLLGRVLTPADDSPGAPPVAVLSYTLWVRRFGRDTGIPGRQVMLDGRPFTVVGVAAAGFFGTTVGSSPDLWVPLRTPGLGQWSNPGTRWLSIIGRLKAGVRREQAEAALDAVARGFPPEFRPERVVLLDGGRGLSQGRLRQQYSRPLAVLMTAVGLLLLIACTNLASLLLARASGRRKEIAIRLAVGAGRIRLVRQLATESLLLAALGGGLGLLIALQADRFLLGFLPAAYTLEIRPDPRFFCFTAVISLLAALFFGLIPTLQATRPSLTPALKDGRVLGDARQRMDVRKVLVVLQLALSLVLLVGAGLFVRTLRNLKETYSGFTKDQVTTAWLDPAVVGYDQQRTRGFYKQLLERLQMQPGVVAASLGGYGAFSGNERNERVDLPGVHPESTEVANVLVNTVAPRYFESVGVPLLVGRDFQPQDHEEAPKVAILSLKAARYLFGNGNPVGKRLVMHLGQPVAMEVVGIAGDTKYLNLREENRRIVYLPYRQTRQRAITLYVRTRGVLDPAAILRREVRSLEPRLPLPKIRTLEALIDESLKQERLLAALSGVFGIIALILTAVGLYGLIAYSVAQRTREIGIRMALGAQTRDVLQTVLAQGFAVILLASGIGLVLAFALTRVASSLLYQVSATDLPTFVGAALVLAGVAMAASYVPARRATKVNPIAALRYE